MVERIQQLLVQCDEQLLGSEGSGAAALLSPGRESTWVWDWGRRVQSTSVGLLGAVLATALAGFLAAPQAWLLLRKARNNAVSLSSVV